MKYLEIVKLVISKPVGHLKYIVKAHVMLV